MASSGSSGQTRSEGFHRISDADRDQLSDLHQRTWDYWFSHRRGENLPHREDIDPIDIPHLLPFINLVDVDHSLGYPRFKHRLNGATVVQHFGHENHNRWFDEVYTPEHLANVQTAYVDAVESRCGNIDTITLFVPDQTPKVYDRLMLPLENDEGRVDMLFLVFDFRSKSWRDMPEFLPLYQSPEVKAEA